MVIKLFANLLQATLKGRIRTTQGQIQDT
uniref:Uncharacterized protein n=1 Tax=Rhizophora mucronata TaxID=61149 RepID=A0A2P2PXZ4_RHIMU